MVAEEAGNVRRSDAQQDTCSKAANGPLQKTVVESVLASCNSKKGLKYEAFVTVLARTAYESQITIPQLYARLLPSPEVGMQCCSALVPTQAQRLTHRSMQLQDDSRTSPSSPEVALLDRDGEHIVSKAGTSSSNVIDSTATTPRRYSKATSASSYDETTVATITARPRNGNEPEIVRNVRSLDYSSVQVVAKQLVDVIRNIENLGQQLNGLNHRMSAVEKSVSQWINKQKGSAGLSKSGRVIEERHNELEKRLAKLEDRVEGSMPPSGVSMLYPESSCGDFSVVSRARGALSPERSDVDLFDDFFSCTSDPQPMLRACDTVNDTVRQVHKRPALPGVGRLLQLQKGPHS